MSLGMEVKTSVFHSCLKNRHQGCVWCIHMIIINKRGKPVFVENPYKLLLDKRLVHIMYILKTIYCIMYINILIYI